MANNIYQIESTTSEKLPAIITTSGDPTVLAPDFALTTGTTEPSTWVAGEWTGTWSDTTGEVNALSPLVGDGETLAVTAGVEYDLWARWTLGTETPVQHCGRVRVS